MTSAADYLQYNVYDPKDLTVEQLLKVLHIGPEHRIVDTGREAILVNWDAILADERIVIPDV